MNRETRDGMRSRALNRKARNTEAIGPLRVTVPNGPFLLRASVDSRKANATYWLSAERSPLSFLSGKIYRHPTESRARFLTSRSIVRKRERRRWGHSENLINDDGIILGKYCSVCVILLCSMSLVKSKILNARRTARGPVQVSVFPRILGENLVIVSNRCAERFIFKKIK